MKRVTKVMNARQLREVAAIAIILTGCAAYFAALCLGVAMLIGTLLDEHQWWMSGHHGFNLGDPWPYWYLSFYVFAAVLVFLAGLGYWAIRSKSRVLLPR